MTRIYYKKFERFIERSLDPRRQFVVISLERFSEDNFHFFFRAARSFL